MHRGWSRVESPANDRAEDRLRPRSKSAVCAPVSLRARYPVDAARSAWTCSAPATVTAAPAVRTVRAAGLSQ